MIHQGRTVKVWAWVLGFLAFASSAATGCRLSSGERVHPDVIPADHEFFQHEANSRYRPIVGTKGMVVANDEVGAAWGAEILRRGGNAVDAAVATGFMLAVTRPQNGSLGGGGFMVYCPAPKGGKSSECSVIDYREKAPAAASRDMFIKDGKPRTDLSQDSALGAGVPGVPAGLLLALDKWGTKRPWEVLAKPIELAEKGVPFSSYLESLAEDRWSAMNDEAKRILGCYRSRVPNKPCRPGETFRQPDLARVLKEISQKGRNGFYKGWVAEKIASGLARGGGVMTAEDLAAYAPAERKPLTGKYRGMEIVTMPPPSNGGAALLQMFHFAKRAHQEGELAEGFGAARTIHALTHGMTLAFADRAHHFGDMDFVNVPLAGLLDSAYLDQRWDSTFKKGRANLPGGHGEPKGGMETTHFAVVDRHGNAVSITTTINENYGSGFVPPGTGVIMNNEMDDFSVQPGVPNTYGLIGAEANAVAPNKRPLSSMTPTIVRDGEGQVRIVIGAAGGPRITTSVFQALMNRLRFGMTLPDAVMAPRFHHQWRPEAVLFEGGYSEDTKSVLRGMGYNVKEQVSLARMHALERFPDIGRVWGVPDRRSLGGAVAE